MDNNNMNGYPNGGFYDSNGYQSNNYIYPYNYNEQPPNETGKCRISLILGIISAVLMFTALFIPAIDFSVYQEEVNLKYNLIKICKNVGFISAPWKGIPVGIILGCVIMLGLSFVKLPQLKLLPCAVVLGMLLIMLLDLGNVIEWVTDVINNFAGTTGTNEITIEKAQVMKSLLAGVYVLAAGWCVGLVSCFTGKK